jgi:hypothetical protein
MSSLVQKWQAIKRQEEVLSEDESDEEDCAAKNEAHIEQWRQEQITRYLLVILAILYFFKQSTFLTTRNSSIHCVSSS